MRSSMTLLAPVMAVTLMAAAVASGELTRYDSFSNAVQSDTLWNAAAAGVGVVTISGGRAVLDMTPAKAGKSAKLTATMITGQLDNKGDFLHLSWDMETLTDRYAGGPCGIAITNPLGTDRVGAGQRGNNSNNANFKDKFFLRCDLASVESKSAAFAGTHYHYDLTLTVMNLTNRILNKTLRIYEYDSQLDNAPDAYAEPIATVTRNGDYHCIIGKPLTIWFYAQKAVGKDKEAVARNRVAFDNLYVGGVGGVPEPASLCLLALWRGGDDPPRALTGKTSA